MTEIDQALRTHTEYLRARRRIEAEERAAVLQIWKHVLAAIKGSRIRRYGRRDSTMLHSLSFADAVTAGALLALVIAAAITDIRSRKIPNWLTLSGMGGGLVLQTVLHGWSGLLIAAEGLLLGFGIYLVFYLIRAMGAGDVKLMAAVGAITGPVVWFNVFLATSVMSGVIALWLSLSNGRLRQTVWNVGYLAVELVHFRPPYYKHPDLDVKSGKALKMPHAVAIAAGVITCLVYGF